MSDIPVISFRDFENRKQEIGNQLIYAAENIGFFTVCDQAYPSVDDIKQQFSLSEQFFAQDDNVKSQTPFIKDKNSGWEKMAQVRPSTGTPDQKESLQLQQHTKGQNWPTTINGFEDKTEKFMINSRKLSMQILSFFALALGFEEDFFDRAHNVTKEDAQSTLRLLYYPDITGIQLPKGYWRAGPHTDFDVLTLLFQHDGGEGLEICPGRKVQTSFAIGDEWTPVPAKTGHIVCNIGDMLMSWSDDRFKSNFHRVRAPDLGQNQQTRMSIAYFNQVNKNVIIQGPLKKYPALTGGDYILQAIARNFSSFK